MNYNEMGILMSGENSKEAALSYQIGPKSVIVPLWRTTAARQGFLRDQRPGLVRWRRDRWWKCPPTAAKWNKAEFGNATAHGPCPFRLSVELGRKRNGAPVALHGRDRSGSTARTDRHWNKPFDETFSVPGLDKSISRRIAGDGA
jgi:hypothetical protein